MQYKYFSNKKLLNIIKAIDWRIKHTSYGMNDIYIKNYIEGILHNRGGYHVQWNQTNYCI